MARVLILAEKREHVRNWAKLKGIMLALRPNFIHATEPSREREKGGYYTVLTWPRNGEAMMAEMRRLEAQILPDDIDQWPVECFQCE